MVPDNQGDERPDLKPPPDGQTHPPDYGHAVNLGYVVEMLMQMQGTLGELKSDVGHLKTATQGYGQRLSRIEKMAWTAIGGLAVLFGVVFLMLRPLINALVERTLGGTLPPL